ncbi:16S rRNA (guanine(966)-N(2))-methyltransferase RsmD [candidate division WWE3 bacterium RIFCSPHIGHO2_12_FULL_38_15]|uniref:16S rRNA (Guanine(966)-N(2))-methyltransferase RsmD n=1 Tax=candidate division WWE3 bacterium RIFCSPHIGHO2_02_FULL_38_14 TaxID=1802620 RepID=A0A1F4V6F9_UNCKA|nr:MAG: 16S rRNA (guanine(966)-N(2))-methyltransferase RsmD [candidate division WWE3 bacterium RIFCSPHIGHO2_01_FULL_38_45]OGC48810.1 MAG: 16S rRNA (guanine(966)-N(2))-methyltransferase RsmD [candidate division WWE3 bacterium RIFCSPHIGHO2_12_FULL_38_15]OGC52765.1 MAG: 16S rRNA (guanine(966)-N(2))-methyltransferase RsmD [candidate division WWE3 bacterium RIFCSPHIGHO2_02_FULL_38_14]OGC53112.1 MAG: 16S rRNA (guanine(966)-N(2))-methyltransferase RsmD [candidate division WWE3 bacterium RIFCSPLOWO2_01_
MKPIRVTSGTAKNTKLNTPQTEGFRAVQDIVKQSVFSILGDKVKDAVCLDLYAGSGSLGIEALSRGAKWCDFVDKDYDAKRVILENLAKCKFEGNYEVFMKSAVKFVEKAAGTDRLAKYDLVFLDPFYENTYHKHLIKLSENILNRGGLIIFMHGENLDMKKLLADTKIKIITQRKFGKSYFDILSL